MENTFSVITTVKKWRYLINNLTPLVNEAKFVFTPEHMEVRAVDPAHVAMVAIKTFPEYYNDNEYTVKKNFECGLDVDSLFGKLQHFKPQTRVKLSVDGIGPTMKFEIFTEYGIFVKRFNTIDTAGMPDPKIPNLGLNKVEVDPKALCFVGRQVGAVSDHIKLIIKSTSTGNKLIIEEIGDTDENLFPLNIHKVIKKEGSGELKAKSLFSTDYMQNALKHVHLADKLVVGLGTDNPISLKYSIMHRSAKNLKPTGKPEFEATALLAPRIESEC